MFTTALGGGILGCPYAMNQIGLYWAFALCILMVCNQHMSNTMYIKGTDMLPNRFASAFEISYLLFGRAGYFMSCVLLTSLALGSLLLYYLLVTENVSSVLRNTSWYKLNHPTDTGAVNDEISWSERFTSQSFCLIVLTLLQLPLIFKR